MTATTQNSLLKRLRHVGGSLVERSGKLKFSFGAREVIYRAMSDNDFDFFIKLGRALEEVRKKGRIRALAKIQNGPKKSSLLTAETLITNWSTIHKLPADHIFAKSVLQRHHCIPGLCHFSDAALDEYCSLVVPGYESDASKIRERHHLVQYSPKKPLVTQIKPPLELVLGAGSKSKITGLLRDTAKLNAGNKTVLS